MACSISPPHNPAAEASGSGFFGQWGAQLKAETPGNWALYPGPVSSIEVEHKSRGDSGDTDIEYLKITIETPGGKGSYETNDDRPGQREVQALLARTFGPAVR
jgi:hypothetical protein